MAAVAMVTSFSLHGENVDPAPIPLAVMAFHMLPHLYSSIPRFHVFFSDSYDSYEWSYGVSGKPMRMLESCVCGPQHDLNVYS